nr:MAG TPA: hypothetical protein [Caudoviricetes sp.]
MILIQVSITNLKINQFFYDFFKILLIFFQFISII